MNVSARKVTDALLEQSKLKGIEFTAWDCICFSCITLVNIAAETPQIKRWVMAIVGTFIDGSIELKHTFNEHGILSKLPEQGSAKDLFAKTGRKSH